MRVIIDAVFATTGLTQHAQHTLHRQLNIFVPLFFRESFLHKEIKTKTPFVPNFETSLQIWRLYLFRFRVCIKLGRTLSLSQKKGLFLTLLNAEVLKWKKQLRWSRKHRNWPERRRCLGQLGRQRWVRGWERKPSVITDVWPRPRLNTLIHLSIQWHS